MPMQFGGGLNWTHPLLQQINRQGDIIQYADQAGRANEQNAMQRQLFNLQMMDRLTGMQEKNALKKSLMEAGDSTDLEQVGMRLLRGGNPAGLDLIMKSRELGAKGAYSLKPGEVRYDASGQKIAGNNDSLLTGDAKNLEVILGRKPTVAELEQFKRSGAQTINLPKISLERESGLVEQGIKDIKENKKDVLMSRAAIDRIDQALNIVEKQGDTVTGIQGQIRRALAPFAKTIGMDVNKATDAQILDSLLTAGAGSLRSQVVGPGPVTNYEQEILQKVSGGKMSYADGVRAVLEEARSQHAGTIDRYNEQINTISGIKGYENIQGVFKPITYTKRQPSAAAVPATPVGATDYTKMTDAELVEFIRRGGK